MAQVLALAKSISTSAAIYEESLRKAGLCEPVFTPYGHLDYPTTSPDLIEAKETLLSQIDELRRSILSPPEVLRELPKSTIDVGCVRALINFQIPELLPLSGTMTYHDLAVKSGLGESILKDMIRLVIPTVGFLTEPTRGHVGHSAVSAMLLRNPEVAAGPLFTFMSVPQSAINLYEALLLDPSGQDQDACPFRVTHRNPEGKAEGIWDRLKRMPEENRWFMATMKVFSTRPAHGAMHLVNGYDWSALQGEVVVDCGGSTGHVAAAIGKQYRSLNIISQDLPAVIKQTQLTPSTLPPNVSLMVHDFFQPQSVVAAAYLFRLILHSWSDASCRRILGSLLPVMRHGTRLIIMELVMKPAGEEAVFLEQQHRRHAFVMNILFNGRERDLEEWTGLVESVDKRFVFQRLVQPEGSLMSILEWIWVDDRRALG